MWVGEANRQKHQIQSLSFLMTCSRMNECLQQESNDSFSETAHTEREVNIRTTLPHFLVIAHCIIINSAPFYSKKNALVWTINYMVILGTLSQDCQFI